MTVSSSHLVLLPSYNTGPRLREVVSEVLRHWQPVLVVVDGSTDGSERALLELARDEPQLTVRTLPQNSGKGAAVLAGTQVARERGFTHVLVMDADGQHPAGSIGEFMAASQRQPEALVLGRPVFPANIPAERLHGRKLSVGLVHFELLGQGVDDPLFGFRVYPVAALLDILGTRRGGRRYDFDTEAAVRLGWAGVPPVNLSAPVRYFSRAEGGVSHFHYVRDNATLVWMHTRLIVELLFWRWPALLRHRRRWRAAGWLNPAVALGLSLMLASAGPLLAAETDSLVNPEHKLAAGAAEWHDLIDTFAHKPDTAADFAERRYFSVRKEPVALKGEVRVSAARGLSLHYTEPEERTVIIDQAGLLMRGAQGEKSPPADPRARAVNDALLHVLRFDFAALDQSFEIYGARDGATWQLGLVPRTDELRRALGRLTVKGDASAVQFIEMRRSEKQYVQIEIAAPRPPAPFTAEELKKYFR
ncbi:MAG TPA: glycosyltransferase [Candidatus Didemnitutus sp.]|nr:glycosyltransferase [Candidatus Didemnitutus sp.]